MYHTHHRLRSQSDPECSRCRNHRAPSARYRPKSFPLLVDRIDEVVARYRTKRRADEYERINSVLRKLNQTLVRASSRTDIDQQVCEIISQSEPYRFAWVGEHDPDEAVVTKRAAAGIERNYLDAITITTDENATADGPTGKAVRTHEIQVMQNIPADPDYEPWRDHALERGIDPVPQFRSSTRGSLWCVERLRGSDRRVRRGRAGVVRRTG
ncbi:hypothetical protein D8S78_06505 [Natrialba swarupiae]|nr:hypothetical protein [Natrialba swarupiae]